MTPSATPKPPPQPGADLEHPSQEPVLLEVPELAFAMVDGEGDPNTAPAYASAVATLFAVSYPIVMTMKRLGQSELKVGPLEGIWWLADGAEAEFDPLAADRTDWRWTAMIRQPEHIPPELQAAAIARAAAKVGADAASRLRFERFHEGLSAQLMHHGPYRDEKPTLERLHAFIKSSGLSFRGRHHEIYLTDPRRAAPSRLRTLLRQPVDRGPAAGG